ncbi:MAG: flagellar protein export ATPase FliI [Thiohalomonadales bacterium]
MARSDRWKSYLQKCQQRVTNPGLVIEGKLTRMTGLTLEAIGCYAPIGARCQVIGIDKQSIVAEVVGFHEDKLFLMPLEQVHGITPNSRVIPQKGVHTIPVGEGLLGRVINGHGDVIDDKGPLTNIEYRPLLGDYINPLHRKPIDFPLDVGIQAINSLFTVGRGQRLGLFAGSGVGKSVLLGMMTKFTAADVIVVGLIGERGREVKEFIDRTLGEEGMRRSVVIAAPADETPVVRLHAASLTLSVAEYFRDQGKHVLLLMDSLTRYAQAQREIALAIGEPPATKGYPPSVFAKLPQLVERAGNGIDGKGSISAFFTVLAEGDDQNDPIADAARAILDGHIVLSRELAEAGHYPAIDIEASISRSMTEIVSETHLAAAREFRRIYSLFQKNRDLISVGAYHAGSDPQIDNAIKRFPEFTHFLQQALGQAVNLDDSIANIAALHSAVNAQPAAVSQLPIS